jgi:quercetin dioxygenase-like cupin family protein
MLACIRLWTGADGQSHFERGVIDLHPGARGDFLSGKMGAVSMSLQQTDTGGTFDWHTAPARQFVITLSGTLDFFTREQNHFSLHPGILLLAEDTAGGGHSWRLVDQEPWRRIYVVLAPGAEVSFTAEVQR